MTEYFTNKMILFMRRAFALEGIRYFRCSDGGTAKRWRCERRRGAQRAKRCDRAGTRQRLNV